MSDHLYLIAEYISKKYGRWVLAAISALLLVPCLIVVHYIINHLFDFVPVEYYDSINIAEEFFLLWFIVLVLWYYHKNHHLLKDQLNQKNRLILFIKHAPISVAMVDTNMTYIATSDRWLTDFKVPAQDITGKSHYDVFSDIQALPRWKQDHQRALSGETIRCEEDSFISLEGKLEWLTYEILPWRHPNGTIGGLIFFVEFITRRVEALNQLRESDARFERAMRGSNDGIFDWNVKTNNVYFSASFKNLMGYQDDEMENTYEGWARLLHPDDMASVTQDVKDHLAGKKPYDVTYRLRHKNGYYIWIAARGQAEWDRAGVPLYFSGSMVDISEKKRLEELKNEFVYVVTHELRTPLSALRGALDMLPRLLGEDLPVKAKKSLDLSLQGCDRLTSLVNDLLEVGKAESGSMTFNIKLHEIGKLLTNAIDMNTEYAHQFQTTLALDHNIPDIAIQVDINRFQQIMSNLISNAAKFSKENGVVTVSSSLDKNEIIIAVKDEGGGIPCDFQKRIFQKFARNNADKPGTGLGLNITKTMVEKMGGKIWFESEQHIGTTFFVSFPAISALKIHQ